MISRDLLHKTLQIASLICLAALSLLYPVIEMLDRWDAPGPSSDSEIEIIFLLTFVALIFVFHQLFKHAFSYASNALLFLCVCREPFWGKYLSRFLLVFTVSPPLLLRI
jgi:hypothetical protein